MASGPDHYREAERAFENAKSYEPGSKQERFQLDAAQYHATMAHAAATALQAALPLIGDDQQITEWCKAVGATTSTPDSYRVAMASALIDEFDEGGLMTPATVERLREVLGQAGDNPR